MPIHLPSRRQFLGLSIGALCGPAIAHRYLAAEEPHDPNVWAFLADTHIASDPETTAHGACMAENLRRVLDEIIQSRPLPAGVIINGDCAWLKGLPGDYDTLVKLVQPVIEAGLSLHFTMGNHDERTPFYAAFARQKPAAPLIDGRHVSMLQLPHANLLLVDTLDKVNVVTGEVGEQQRAWLQTTLAKHADRPAIVLGHHYPQFLFEKDPTKITGMRDTAEFMALLHAAPNAKAFIFGHSHDYKHLQTDQQLHLINQPPVGYLFNRNRPNGWMRATFTKEQMLLELRTLDPKHELQGEQHAVAFS